MRWFAQLRDWRGRSEEEVRLQGEETAEALFLRLVPAERRLPVRYAVGDAWAAATTALQDGDDVVFLPPVGGG